jgi:hypothetical protein
VLKRDVQCIQKMRVFAVEAARGFRDPVNAVVKDLRDFDFLPGAAEKLRFDTPAERSASAGPQLGVELPEVTDEKILALMRWAGIAFLGLHPVKGNEQVVG